jgi:uncharacterized protein YbjT (DUF2867 family)
MILITGATSNVGRYDVSQLLGMGAAGRGFARNPHSVGVPGDVDVVCGGLSVPDALNVCLDGVEVVFLVWPFFTAEAAPPFLEAVTKHARRIVYLSSEGVGDYLEQQTDTITSRIAAKLAA